MQDWRTADEGGNLSKRPSKPQTLTNVTRIVRALCETPDSGNFQVVYHQHCNPKSGNIQDNSSNHMEANKIDGLVYEAYSFLVTNFSPGDQLSLDGALAAGKGIDEIVLLGSGIGAFVARAVAGLLSDIGLLTKRGMEEWEGIWNDWKNQHIEGSRGVWFRRRFPTVSSTEGELKFASNTYRQTLMTVSSPLQIQNFNMLACLVLVSLHK